VKATVDARPHIAIEGGGALCDWVDYAMLAGVPSALMLELE